MKHGINCKKFRELKKWNSIQTEPKKSNSITAFKHKTEKEVKIAFN